MNSHSREGSASRPALLEGKRAIVFGAGGSIGAAVAKEFAAEGAEVILAGRSNSVEVVAEQIVKASGRAQAHLVDAQDELAVDQLFRKVAKDSGQLDICFTAVGPLASQYGNGTNAVELSVDHFMASLSGVVRANFITACF
jgi:3-oxoacyl-[acyl-carrier protein] reductase